jgi:hypothetical protein
MEVVCGEGVTAARARLLCCARARSGAGHRGQHLARRIAAADLVQDVLIPTLQKLRAGEVRDPARLASFILGTYTFNHERHG